MISLLELSSEDHELVHVVGIHGKKGMGKKTLTTIVLNCIRVKFEGSSFLELDNIGDPGNLVNLQGRLKMDFFKVKPLQIQDLNGNINEIKKNIVGRKLLLVLHNVTKSEQAKFFTADGQGPWFSHGSRIIITTRNKQVLDDLRVHKQYEVQELDRNDSLRLFCRHTFGSDLPLEGYERSCNTVLHSVGGRPSDLVSLGYSLSRPAQEKWSKEIEEWKRHRDRSTVDDESVDRSPITYSYTDSQFAAHPILVFFRKSIFGILRVSQYQRGGLALLINLQDGNSIVVSMLLFKYKRSDEMLKHQDTFYSEAHHQIL